MGSFEDELERRFGEELYRPDFEWRGDWLIGLTADSLEIARAVLASPVAARLERLFLFSDLHHNFGHTDSLSTAPLAPLAELLAAAPLATTVHASAETIEVNSHDRLETLSLVTRTWPLAGAAFPALQRLELCITETAVTRAELANALRACPRLTELVLRGAGFAPLLAELGAFAYPRGLALVVDVELESATAVALAESPGTLAELSRLELPAKSPTNRLALIGLEQAFPLATRGHRLASVTRWPVVERGCFGPLDPSLRIWEWQTREEGRSSGWIAFLSRRADETIAPREADLLRACAANVPGSAAVYADWLEETGELARAKAIRAAGLPFHPQSLPEAMVLLACAWKRISSSGWPPGRPVGSIAPLSLEHLQRYTDMFSDDEHPLALDTTRTIPAAQFDDGVRSLVDMMREPAPATLRENEWLVRDDVATFTPPLGPARAALQLRDAWNDRFLAAETAHGYALLIWGTDA
jgi:hypothetical protein